MKLLDPLKNKFNQYVNYSRKDRNGILVLATLILLAVVANEIVVRTEAKSDYDYEALNQEWDKWQHQQKLAQLELQSQKKLFSFNPNTIPEASFDSLDLPVFVKRNILNYRNAGGQFKYASQLRKIYGMNDSIFEAIEKYIEIPKTFAAKTKGAIERPKPTPTLRSFDPNTVNGEELNSLGFNTFQAKNILSYRKKGGVFKRPSDLLKIYGVDSPYFHVVEPFITIVKSDDPHFDKASKPAIAAHIELNTADSALLVQLRGIGPVYASRILKYRKLLGGFHHKRQLLEVYNFPEETFLAIENLIEIDTLKIEKTRLNFADFRELLRHPYLSKEQVENIIAYRDRNGAFKSVGQLNSIPTIDSVAYTKISPYLSCR